MATATQASVRNIPLLDLKAQHALIRGQVLAEVTRVIDSQKFILGDDVKHLEGDIANYCSVQHAIGCASGSDALLLALMALEIGPGDEVITTPYTFFATTGSITRLGATPIFVDVEPDTFNLDVAKVAEALGKHSRVRAILPVHLFGACADMDALGGLAADRGIPIIEDAAQSIGSEYKGRRAGSIGQIGCFSFFPSKNLGAYGDGGMMTTNDDALAEKLRALRVHGTKRKYYHDLIGVNSRLDALQAAVLRVKLRHLDSWTAGRQRNAKLYRQKIAELRIPVAVPVEQPYQTRHIYNQFVIVGDRRDELRPYLKEQGIGTEIYYPLPMHVQTCFAYLGYKAGDFPVAERLAKQSLALPVYPELDSESIDYVCQALKRFYS
ncbi:MAG TPA: DegT/DnrJ/EryC1/StrS family aminotransferase [Bryobacteraceae bacterium]|nr:DegT/DnrJ/EryC1/StrS family aminotransferase [Bryobacteraceae bacterium]